MKKPNLPQFATAIRIGLRKHSSEILTGLGIGGMITTTVMAVSATPKAILLLNEEEVRRSKLEGPQTSVISKKDVVKITWKCYIPSAVVGGVSIACLVGASSVNSKRHAALATAYSISESVLKEYQEKVIETIGEKKETEIRDSIARDHMEKNPVCQQSIIITNKGDSLCYDDLSGRYFKSDIDKIKRVENDIYHKLINERYIALNDFYYEIGLESIGVGDDLGWNIDDGKFELFFTSNLTPDGTPCLVINYRIAPKQDYCK